MTSKFWRYFTVYYHTPASQAGSIFLFEYPINFQQTDDVTWFYSPGTRRVRLAPEFKYDTPIANYGGALDYDEIDLFYGRMDKFDFKLVGEKEMIVPYNDYKFANTTQDALLGQHTLNPDGVRWERHRVWIVDATLKPGERHAYSRWTFYIDEDSWQILATESYDHSNAIYRIGFSYPYQNYAQTNAINFARSNGIYDLSKGTYYITFTNTKGNGFYDCSPDLPNMTQFTPQALSAQAIR
jgi:hypothetical protein